MRVWCALWQRPSFAWPNSRKEEGERPGPSSQQRCQHSKAKCDDSKYGSEIRSGHNRSGADRPKVGGVGIVFKGTNYGGLVVTSIAEGGPAEASRQVLLTPPSSSLPLGSNSSLLSKLRCNSSAFSLAATPFRHPHPLLQIKVDDELTTVGGKPIAGMSDGAHPLLLLFLLLFLAKHPLLSEHILHDDGS
eukprot:1616136-Rhodomonas_salina.4